MLSLIWCVALWPQTKVFEKQGWKRKMANDRLSIHDWRVAKWEWRHNTSAQVNVVFTRYVWYHNIIYIHQSFEVCCSKFYLNFIELNRLVRKLDKRRKRKVKKGGFRSKPREVSTPSQLQPPVQYPDWAVTLPTDTTIPWTNFYYCK